MPSFAQQLISDCLVAQGDDRTKADKVAAFVMRVLPAAGLVKQAEIEAFESDATIYNLRGKTLDGKPLTVRVISQRCGCCPRSVFKAIRRHTRIRHEVLKLIA
jgi:hypothetical protein